MVKQNKMQINFGSISGRSKSLKTTSARTWGHQSHKNDLLRTYINDSMRHPLLTQEETREAFRRYHEQGDKKARELLIVSNLRLVVKIAFRYYYGQNQFSAIDLVQEGNLGLMHAVNKYELERGVKFSYYASFWIKAYISKYIIDNWRLVRIGTTQMRRKLFTQLDIEKKRLFRLGLNPDAEVIAENLGVEVEDILDMEKILSNRDFSLDSPVNEYNDSSWVELMPSKMDTEKAVFKSDLEKKGLAILDRFRETLSERELNIFNSRICCEEKRTLQDIGDELNLSRERVRQIENKIYEKLYKLKKREYGASDIEESLADDVNSHQSQKNIASKRVKAEYLSG